MIIKMFILHLKSCYSKTDLVVTKQCEYGVHLLNSYIYAKFERVLVDIYSDIHQYKLM